MLCSVEVSCIEFPPWVGIVSLLGPQPAPPWEPLADCMKCRPCSGDAVSVKN